MKFNIFGNDIEFTLGFLSEDQIEYLNKLLKESDENYIKKNIWETDAIPKPWNEIDDLIHCYGALYDDDLYIRSDDGNIEIYKKSKHLGQFEIDYYNDDRLEFLNYNKKLFIGWNQLGSGSRKGFKKLKFKDFNIDFQNKFSKGKFNGGLLGVKISEKGNFGKFELPEIFDKSKLILSYTELKFGYKNIPYDIKYLTNMFYDGKKILVEQDGNTSTTSSQFFIIKPTLYNKKFVTFNLIREFKAKSY